MGRFWTALYQSITWYRGNFARFYKDMCNRETAYAAAWDRDRSAAFAWPEQSRAGIRRILGFFIGAVPDFPPTATPDLAAITPRPP